MGKQKYCTENSDINLINNNNKKKHTEISATELIPSWDGEQKAQYRPFVVMLLSQVSSQETKPQECKAKVLILILYIERAVVQWCCESWHQRHSDHTVFFSSYLLKISQGDGRPSSKDRNMPALSDGGPDIARAIFQKPHSPEARTSQWLEIPNICSRLSYFPFQQQNRMGRQIHHLVWNVCSYNPLTST